MFDIPRLASQLVLMLKSVDKSIHLLLYHRIERTSGYRNYNALKCHTNKQTCYNSRYRSESKNYCRIIVQVEGSHRRRGEKPNSISRIHLKGFTLCICT